MPKRSIQTRSVEARFYADDEGVEPTFVMIDGTAYRRDDNQEEAGRFLEMEEVWSKLEQALSPEQWLLFFHYVNLAEAHDQARMDAIEKDLVLYLPSHAPIIRYAFTPEEHHVSGTEQWQHAHCILPALASPRANADEEQQ